MRLLLTAGILFASAVHAQQVEVPDRALSPSTARQAAPAAAATDWASRATALGATGVTVRPAPDGGIYLGGKLEGAQFALGIPAGWQGDGLLYAHGYSTPGMPVEVAEDPAEKGPGTGLLGDAYRQGFAVGHSAYDKAGLGVETGVRNTVRLRDFLAKLGGKRVYVLGDSMGGGIVVALLEKYPHAFAGGFARCGVIDSWRTLLAQITDQRLAYNYFTHGTPYALPGPQDATRNAISSLPPTGMPNSQAQGHVFQKMLDVAATPLALWNAAAKSPGGAEAKIVRNVTAIGGFDYDAASLAFPLVTTALGAEDMTATAGGWVYDNRRKRYDAPGLSRDEVKALNGGIQRVQADRRALAYLDRWYEATGWIGVPLIVMHNRTDSLVPYAQQRAYVRKVERAGRARWLAAYTVPATRAPLPVGGVEGYTHCGFSKQQNRAAWAALRSWVEHGERPALDLIR